MFWWFPGSRKAITMAFTGSATVKQVSDRKFRITGLSLAGAAAGTISLLGGTGDVKLPDLPNWGPYKSAGSTVALADAIECHAVPAASGAVAAVGSQSPAIVKTGTTEADFLITVTNLNGAGVASGALEFFVTFHD